jgi:hypothetical protein
MNSISRQIFTIFDESGRVLKDFPVENSIDQIFFITGSEFEIKTIQTFSSLTEKAFIIETINFLNQSTSFGKVEINLEEKELFISFRMTASLKLQMDQIFNIVAKHQKKIMSRVSDSFDLYNKLQEINTYR